MAETVPFHVNTPLGECMMDNSITQEQLPASLSKPQITLLLFFKGSSRQLDPIRIMKALFVFNMESPERLLPKDARYEFVPYSYGPYSAQVSADLDYLSMEGYLQATQAAGKSWNYYALSVKGESLASRLISSFDPATIDYLHRLREYVAALPFRNLLNVVYAKYPEYAVKSVFMS